jgi:hypothetical protein
MVSEVILRKGRNWGGGKCGKVKGLGRVVARRKLVVGVSMQAVTCPAQFGPRSRLATNVIFVPRKLPRCCAAALPSSAPCDSHLCSAHVAIHRQFSSSYSRTRLHVNGTLGVCLLIAVSSLRNVPSEFASCSVSLEAHLSCSRSRQAIMYYYHIHGKEIIQEAYHTHTQAITR